MLNPQQRCEEINQIRRTTTTMWINFASFPFERHFAIEITAMLIELSRTSFIFLCYCCWTAAFSYFFFYITTFIFHAENKAYTKSHSNCVCECVIIDIFCLLYYCRLWIYYRHRPPERAKLLWHNICELSVCGINKKHLNAKYFLTHPT